MKFGSSQVCLQVWIVCIIIGKFGQLLRKGNFKIKMAIDQSFLKVVAN